MDYSKGKIYQIGNKINDNIYIGSTCQQLSRRMGDHRSRHKQPKYVNILLYKSMLEIGVDNFFIELLEDYPCESKKQLHEREGYWIKLKGESSTGDILNQNIPARNYKTRYSDNKEEILERSHDRYKTMRETILQKKKEYYIAHREEILQKKEVYRDNKREELHVKYKEFYSKNKDRLLMRRKELYQEHNETMRNRRKEYRERNKELVSTQKKVYYERHKERISAERKELYEKTKNILNARRRELARTKKSNSSETSHEDS